MVSKLETTGILQFIIQYFTEIGKKSPRQTLEMKSCKFLSLKSKKEININLNQKVIFQQTNKKKRDKNT
jgi:hypothetical protein